MVLIHRGKGYVVLIAVVIARLVMNVISTALYDNDYYANVPSSSSSALQAVVLGSNAMSTIVNSL